MWHPGSNAWGCDRCRELIGGPPQFPAPMAGNPYQSAPNPYQPLPPAAPATPKCPRCWGDATFHPQMNQWGCDRCKQMLTPEQVKASQQAAQGVVKSADAGIKVLKVVLWVVLLIILVVIRVALRSGRW